MADIEALENLRSLIEEEKQAFSEAEEEQKDEERKKAGGDACSDEDADNLQLAQIMVSILSSVILARWEYLKIPQAQKDAISESAVGVLAKYKNNLPLLLKDYEAELRLGVVVAVAGSGLYLQHKAHIKNKKTEKQFREKPVGLDDEL